MRLVSLSLLAALPSTNALCPSPTCYTPLDANFNATDFNLWVSASGARSLQVAPGTYAIAVNAATGVHLQLSSGLTDMALDFTGVTLVCASRRGQALLLPSAQNTSIVGLTFRYAQPPSNTAAILAVNVSAGTLDVAVEAGHPTEDFEAGTVKDCNVFDSSTRLRVPLGYDMYISSLAPLGGGVYRIAVGGLPLAFLRVGYLLGCRVPGGRMTAVLDACTACTLRDVALYGGPSFGFFDGGGGGGNSYMNISIRMPDPPPGAATRPLLSTSADGLHSAGARVGPRIEGAHFTGMDDDGIAVHGGFRLVLDADAPSGRVWTCRHLAAAVGDRFSFYSPTFQPQPPPLPSQGYAPLLFSVTALAPAGPHYTPPANSSKTMPSQTLPCEYEVLTLSPASALPPLLAFDWVSVNVDTVGAGYHISNSTITNHRARGMLLKAPGGLVENCSITNSSLGGIIVTPELYWEEATYSQNVTLRGNTLTLTSSGMQSYGGIALGAVAPGNALAEGVGHANIVIEDNVVIDAGYYPIWLNAAANVRLLRNRIVTPFHAPSSAQLPSCCMPLPHQQIAVFAQSLTDFVAQGNCVDPAPPGSSALTSIFNVSQDSTGSWAGGVVLC